MTIANKKPLIILVDREDFTVIKEVLKASIVNLDEVDKGKDPLYRLESGAVLKDLTLKVK
jgi:hypothetical protein